jgi:hypothetical protein
MLLPAYSAFQARSEEARCLMNLRNLFVAASGYLQANESWPQVPTTLITTDSLTYAKKWVAALTPYGAPHSSWICPTLQRTFHFPMDAIDVDTYYRIDYTATAFNANAMTPRLAGSHPWFIEKAGVHPRGNLMILADGSSAALLDYVNVPSGN